MGTKRKANDDFGDIPSGSAKILLFDVETSPNLGWVWAKYEQDVIGDFVRERQIISVAWKWLGESKVHVIALPMFGEYKKNRHSNKELITAFHKIISQADIVIGHNVCAFDDRMVNTDIIFHGLTPPPPHKCIDTLKIAKKHFRFNSNKLNDLGAFLKCGKKLDTGGFKLWTGCIVDGDPKAWKRMMAYNKKDVILLEKVYTILRPWMTNHPDLNDADCNPGCPSCRSHRMERRGWRIDTSGRKRRYQCQDCGKWSVGKVMRWTKRVKNVEIPTRVLRYRQ